MTNDLQTDYSDSSADKYKRIFRRVMPEVEHGYDCLPPLKNIESYRLVVGIVFTVWNILALFSLLLLVYLFFLLGKQITTPVYRLMNCLYISQVIFMFSYCAVMVPCTYSKCLFYSRTVNMLLSMPHTLGYFSKITFNCLIAIERISMFLCKSFHHFVETHTLLYISIGWFVGVLTIISTTVIGCWKT